MEACAENLESVIKRELERRYPDCEVSFLNVQKNNGLMLRGVVIAAPEERIQPTIYMDEYIENCFYKKITKKQQKTTKKQVMVLTTGVKVLL